MDLRELVRSARSIRRFEQDKPLSETFMLNLIDLARFAPSGGNLQPIKYTYSVDKKLNDKVFNTLSWAGYLADWDGPKQGEQPAGYIIVCLDKEIKSETIDHGFSTQNILLGAAEQRVGACVIKSINKQQLCEILKLDKRYEILLVIALGYPAETVKMEEVNNENIRYWRDRGDVFHVPKRALKELIISKNK